MIKFALDTSINLLIVATKTDKLNQKEKLKSFEKIEEKLEFYSLKKFIPFSARTKLGKREVWTWIENLILKSCLHSIKLCLTYLFRFLLK